VYVFLLRVGFQEGVVLYNFGKRLLCLNRAGSSGLVLKFKAQGIMWDIGLIRVLSRIELINSSRLISRPKGPR